MITLIERKIQMNKEKYIKPEFEVIEFDCEDIMTVSGNIPGVDLPDDDFNGD